MVGAKYARVRVGVRATTHSLRRLYATTLYRNGCDLRTLCQLMRHASINTTMSCYIDAEPSAQLDAVAKLGSSLAQLIYIS